jgi:hypothetical protein
VGQVGRPLAGSDPGLNRFRAALQAVLTVGLILAAEALFVHVTRALQTQARSAALPYLCGPRVNVGRAESAIELGAALLEGRLTRGLPDDRVNGSVFFHRRLRTWRGWSGRGRG